MKKRIFFTILLCAMFSVALYAEWSSDPSINTVVCNLPGEDASPKVVAGPTGDIYVGYFSKDEGIYNVRLQRYNSAGNALWLTNGLLISDHTSMGWLTDWDMTVDQDNYAILTFQDIRNAGNNNIYAYRIAPDGTFMWGPDGLELSNTAVFDAAPKVTVTSAGNAIVAWTSEDVVRIQKISPNGTLLWGATGIEISGTNGYTWPQPIAVENDCVIVKYFDDTGSTMYPTRYIYAQKYDTNGTAAWLQPCAISTAGGISAWTQDLPIVLDENNGFFIGWHEDRDGDMNADIYIQHVNSSGVCQFTANGILASTNHGNEHYYPFLAYLEDTQMLYVYWNEMDLDQVTRGIYGQKIDVAGTRKWADAGKMILPLSLTDIYPFGAGHTDTDVAVFYTEGLADEQVKAIALDSDGDFIWTGDIVTMCSVNSSKVHPEACSLTGSQWVVAWEDERSGRDIYAQNINTDGTLGYIPVSVEPEYNEGTLPITAAPNPFLSSTTISFSLTANLQELSQINIFNIKGQLVRTLAASSFPNPRLGMTEGVWDGKDEAGKEVKSGIYFCTLETERNTLTRKVIKLK